MKTTNVLFGTLAITLALAAQVQAQFDVVGDFSTIANPSGVWSYGWATNAESPFQLLATEVQYYSDLGWENDLFGVADSEMCSIVKNFAGSFVAGTFALNSDTLHLDTGEYAVMTRFVAPKSNNYAVRGLFRLEDTDTQAHNLYIVANGNKTNFSVVTSSGAYNTEYPFNFSITLTQGETMDFVVSSVNGNYNNLGMGLKATIGPLIAGLYNTGVNNDGTLATQGTEDSNYALVSVPSGSAGTAFVVPIQAPNWYSSASDANWLSPATGGALVDAGQYDYRLTFSMIDAQGNPLDPARATITGNWAADDSAMLFLNGAWVANNTTGFAYLSPFTLSSGFRAGTNTLDFLVINAPIGPSQSGLLVSDLSGTAAFATASVTLIADPINGGGVTGGGTFNVGSQEQISATANSGWTFTGWNDGNMDNPRTITVPSNDVTYVASFTTNTELVALLAVPPTGGLVDVIGTFEIGSQVQISATANNGWTFTGWNDGNTQNPRTITVQASGAAYGADFIFTGLNAQYAGLFYDPNGIAPQSSGAFKATLSAAGSFSASLASAGKTYSFTGRFSPTGTTSNTIVRHGQTPLTVQLILDSPTGDVLTGQVSTAAWSAGMMAERTPYSSANHAPQSGKYTLVIPGGANAAVSPGGDGYGAVIVGASGSITVSGALGDGTTLSQSSTLTEQGSWPFYDSLYSGGGEIIGWLTFSNAPMTDLSGPLTWIKPSQPASKLYRGGITNLTQAVGSAYGFTNGHAILNFGSGEVLLSGGNLAGDITNAAVVTANGKVTGTNKLTLTVKTASGLFSGSIINPATKKAITLTGAVLEKQNVAAGYFLGTNQSGEVFVGPVP